MNPIIKFENISVSFNDYPVLENITFSIDEKDFFVIMGPNGGGKTTLLKVLLGLTKPEKGQVTILSKEQRISHLIGYVPQFSSSDREFPINVWDTVLLGRLGKKGLFQRFNDDDHKKTGQALQKVGMQDFKNKQIGLLSEGQRQRVFVARALASDPEILILDEPTASIDKQMSNNIYELLNELKKQITIILVTHDLGTVSGYVTKLACLNRKLYFHNSKELDNKDFEEAYGCPFELVAHGVPHRVYKSHAKGDQDAGI
ncbi:metal ABC transporter ATP-binding protein [Candidatus Margulisiibacteriota bacterium]